MDGIEQGVDFRTLGRGRESIDGLPQNVLSDKHGLRDLVCPRLRSAMEIVSGVERRLSDN